MKTQDTFAISIINQLGGTCAVAAMCDIQPPSVSDWKKYGIPKPWLKYFREIRPDLFERHQEPANV